MIEAYMYKLVELLADIVDANMAFSFIGIFAAKDNFAKKWRQMFVCAVGWGSVCFVLDQKALLSAAKSMLILCGIFILVRWIFQVKWEKVLFWEIIYVVISAILELLLMFCVHFFGDAEVAAFLEMGQDRMTIIVIEKTVCALMVVLSYRLVGEKEQVYFHEKFERVVMVICAVIIAMLLFFWIYNTTGRYAEIVTLSFLLLSAGTILFLMYALFSVTEKVESQQQLELVQLQNKVLQQSLTETQNAYAHWQKQIHDYKNTIVCLSSMMEGSNHASVRAYLNQELEQINRTDHIIHCGNTMLDAILSLKCIEAERRNIFFSVQGGIEDKLQIPEIEVGRVLGNLLDNAIEGAGYSEVEAYVEVILETSEDGFTIEVTNSAVDEKIDFNRTSKENKGIHGIGLQSVRETVKKNGGIFEIEQFGNRVTARVEF